MVKFYKASSISEQYSFVVEFNLCWFRYVQCTRIYAKYLLRFPTKRNLNKSIRNCYNINCRFFLSFYYRHLLNARSILLFMLLLPFHVYFPLFSSLKVHWIRIFFWTQTISLLMNHFSFYFELLTISRFSEMIRTSFKKKFRTASRICEIANHVIKWKIKSWTKIKN